MTCNPRKRIPGDEIRPRSGTCLSVRRWVPGYGLVLLFWAFIMNAAHGETGLPILIDTGIGEEFADLLAISQAARTPGLNLTAVTTSSFSTEESARTVQKLLSLLSRPDVPVAYGDVSRSSSSPWLHWGQDFQPSMPARPHAEDLIIEMSRQYDGDLSLILTGPLTNLAAALRKDPEIAGRIHRIYLTGLDCPGPSSPNLSIDPESARIVFSTTIPITVFPNELCRDLVLTRNRILKIARCRSPLTDELLHLTCQYRNLLTGDEPMVSVPACLAVAYANTPAYTLTEVKRYDLVDGGLIESEGMNGREIQVATNTHQAALMRELVSRLGDTNLDFGTTFAHFIVELNKLGKDALLKVQQGLQGGVPVPEVSDDKSANEAFQQQALAYINGYIDLLTGLDDPVARRMLDRFQESILRVARIGWWFPDWFYEKWCYEGTPGTPMVFHFGIANEAAQELTEVHGSVTVEGHTESVSVASSTREIRFALVVEASHLPQTWPSSVQLKTDFTCRGRRYALSTQVPLVQAPPFQVKAVRCATDTLDIGIISSVTSMLTVQIKGSTQENVFSCQVHPTHDLAWNKVSIQRRDWNQADVARIGGTQNTGTKPDSIARVVVLPPTGEIMLVEPEGPSKSPCFAVSRKGKWGWATDSMYGSDSIEYRVTSDMKVSSSTGPLFMTVEYFNEGDDLDTFRIEGATETAVYQPLTAWMTKPEERGWRTDKFRVSPMVEAMIRSHTLRWLRIQSGKDGDEIIRSIRFE